MVYNKKTFNKIYKPPSYYGNTLTLTNGVHEDTLIFKKYIEPSQ